MTISDIHVTLKIPSAFGKGVYSVTPVAAELTQCYVLRC